MPPTLLKCPPFDHLSEKEAFRALLAMNYERSPFTLPRAAKRQEDLRYNFLLELERGAILSMNPNAPDPRRWTTISWVWHQERACGLVFGWNPHRRTLQFAHLAENTSSGIAFALGELLKKERSLREKLTASKEVRLYGTIEQGHLIAALATGIFSKDTTVKDPMKAARAWIERRGRRFKRPTGEEPSYEDVDTADIPDLDLMGIEYVDESVFWQTLSPVGSSEEGELEDEIRFEKLNEGQISFFPVLDWATWADSSGTGLGVLIHKGHGIFLPSFFAIELEMVAPPLAKFTPSIAARTCLHRFDWFCSEIAVPDNAIVNHVPTLISREEIKAILRKYWDEASGDLDECFDREYSEES